MSSSPRSKHCAGCGHRFWRNNKFSNAQWWKTKFCSTRCSGALKQTIKDRVKECIQCGREFGVGKEGIKKWRIRRHCSIKCEYLSRKGVKRSNEFKSNASKKSKGRVMSQQAKDKLSRANYGKHIPQEMRDRISLKLIANAKAKGHVLPNKLTDIGKLSKTLRTSRKYYQWRAEVFHRDNYACVICGLKNSGKTPLRIEADHFPDSFYYLINRVCISSDKADWSKAALAYSPLWDIANGRTLCRKCHVTHTRVGRRSGLTMHQRQHLTHICNQALVRLKEKYTGGAIEHGGNLDVKPDIIEMLIDEAIDLVVYAYTLRDQIRSGMIPKSL